MGLRVNSVRKTVTTPGSPVVLNMGLKNVVTAWIAALPTNTKPVYIGASNVLATPGSENGALLTPGAMMCINAGMSNEGGLLDLTSLYVDAEVAGEGVSIMVLRQ